MPERGLAQCVYKGDAQPLLQLQWGLSLFPYLLGGGGVLPYNPLLHILLFLQVVSVFAGIKCFSSKMR